MARNGAHEPDQTFRCSDAALCREAGRLRKDREQNAPELQYPELRRLTSRTICPRKALWRTASLGGSRIITAPKADDF
jgi:hypothetical protein